MTPPQTELQLSVIIPSYRSEGTLGRVLAKLCPQLAALPHEVIVVDSASDGSAARIGAPYANVSVIEIPERLSCGAARNHGAKSARGRHILFVDADCVPEPGWGEQLRTALGQDPDVLSGAIANGTPDSRPGSVQYWVEFSRFTPDGSSREQHFTPSFNLLIRRAVLESLPPYPEDFLLAEDLVFDSHLRQAGYLPRFEPRLVVAHQNRKTFKVVRRHLFSLGFGSGRVRVLIPGIKGAFLRRVPFIVPLLIPYAWIGLARRLFTSSRPAMGNRLGTLILALPGVFFWNLGFLAGLLCPRAGGYCYNRLLHPGASPPAAGVAGLPPRIAP